MDKARLLERLRLGDEALLKEIYDKFKPDFIRWAVRFGIDRAEAEDVFQLSVVILYDNVMTGKLTQLSSSLKTYLFSIGRHKAMERSRELSNRFSTIDPLLFDLIADDSQSDEQIEFDIRQLKDALILLGNPCKELLEMMYFQKLSQDIISDRMGYKGRDTVKSKKYKCIHRLKKILENQEDNETDNT